MNFRTIRQIENRNSSTGHYFFEPSTMRFFSSRVHCDVYGGCLFVTSEKGTHQSTRLYTVRKIEEDGSITTVGGFQAFHSRYAAHAYARETAKELKADK